MSDPISGGLGKATQDMIADMQRQMMEQHNDPKVEGASFQDVLAQKTQGIEGVQAHQQVNEAQKTTQIDPAQELTQKVASVEDGEGMKGFKKILDQVVDGQDKLESIISRSLSGEKFDYQELLAIQASVYKFSQELDLTSKVVEKATSGVKQTMQTQV